MKKSCKTGSNVFHGNHQTPNLVCGALRLTDPWKELPTGSATVYCFLIHQNRSDIHLTPFLKPQVATILPLPEACRNSWMN